MQLSMFDGKKPFKINKPIRLIELFAGIGAQAKALERLGVEFEHYRAVEIDKYAVKSYNAIHGTNFEPSDITKITGKDLGIVDTDKYTYILTYSFPCQDISVAGNQKGYAKGSGTRSGLLWEVERLLTEIYRGGQGLPQVLLMENVPEVIGKKNIKHFAEWVKFLDELGYKSKWELLNAKDFGVPQNRNRCFMVSVLGDYYYEFPEKRPLTKRLKDLLEDKVDEKYYLSNKAFEYIVKREGRYTQLCDDKTQIAKSAITDGGNCNWTGNFIKDKPIIYDDYNGRIKADQSTEGTLTTNCGNDAERNGVKIIEPMNNYVIGGLQAHQKPRKDGICPTLTEAMGMGGGQTPIIAERFFKQALETAKENDCQNGDIIDAYNQKVAKDGITPTVTTRPEGFKTAILPIQNYRIRKLTPKECWRLMDFDDEDFDKAKWYSEEESKEILKKYPNHKGKRHFTESQRIERMSDSAMYKQAGNSIVVSVLEAIFKKML